MKIKQFQATASLIHGCSCHDAKL